MRKAMLFAVLAWVLGCSGGAPEEAGGNVVATQKALSSAPQSSRDGEVSGDVEVAVKGLLEPAVVKWDPAEIARGPSPSKLGPRFNRPEEVAQVFLSDRMEYVETRANGRAVFRNARQDVTVKGSARAGYWKMMRKTGKDGPAKGAFSDSDASADALRLFAMLDLPAEEAGRLVSTGLALRAIDGTSQTVARHVRIHRVVNGCRVVGSHLMVTYALDGSPFRVEVRWPEFRLTAFGAVRTRAEAIESIAQVVSRSSDGEGQVAKVLSQLVYRFDEDEGTFEPVVVVDVFRSSEHEQPQTIEYSLVDGMTRVDGVARVDG